MANNSTADNLFAVLIFLVFLTIFGLMVHACDAVPRHIAIEKMNDGTYIAYPTSGRVLVGRGITEDEALGNLEYKESVERHDPILHGYDGTGK